LKSIKSLGDLVGTREIFLTFSLSFFAVLSRAKKNSTHFPPKDFIKFFFIIIIISWDVAAEDFSALDSS
jgi:hypothetical protein